MYLLQKQVYSPDGLIVSPAIGLHLGYERQAIRNHVERPRFHKIGPTFIQLEVNELDITIAAHYDDSVLQSTYRWSLTTNLKNKGNRRKNVMLFVAHKRSIFGR